MKIGNLRLVRSLLIFFMLALIASGLTAIPLQWEVSLLNRWFGVHSWMASIWPLLSQWISRINDGVQDGYGHYPFLAYGTDWLAFGHVAIALFFIGPLRDPVKNLWVIEAGMIACLMLVPWALILGAVRDIPIFWRFIDMSFGIIGMVPLWLARGLILNVTTGL